MRAPRSRPDRCARRGRLAASPGHRRASADPWNPQPCGGDVATQKQRKQRSALVNILVRIRRERPELTEPEIELAAGRIVVAGARITNPRTLVRADAPLALDAPAPLRGTRKLEAALAAFAVDVRDRVALDLGASTGGFTVALLDAGARR